MAIDNKVTVLIPTSPVPRHPDTAMLEECVAAMRAYLPDAPLIIMADGVRPQMEHRRGQYEGYKERLVRLVDGGAFGPARLMTFDKPSQQAIMTRAALETIKTPLIMFVEHDAVLRTEPRMYLGAAVSLLLSGEANVARLYAWGEIWHEHAPLMRGELSHAGVRFTKTVQYSQWPLLSTAAYHRQILQNYFQPAQRVMIETVMYGAVVGTPWEAHRIAIYGPDGQPGFRHLNGRVDQTTGVRDPAEW